MFSTIVEQVNFCPSFFAKATKDKLSSVIPSTKLRAGRHPLSVFCHLFLGRCLTVSLSLFSFTFVLVAEVSACLLQLKKMQPEAFNSPLE